MSSLALNRTDFTFTTEELSQNELRVHSFSGRESLSQPFCFVVQLISDLPDIDLDKQVGTKACLRLRGLLPNEERYTRPVHGVIERFDLLAVGKRHSSYAATLVPTMAPLRHTQNSRIFQQQATADIVRKVLKAGQVPGDWIQTLLHGTYGARDYCVQYQESDFDFCSRLLEEEGIFYFFDR